MDSNSSSSHSLPLEVSCDFNIGLMNWTIGQEIGGVDYSFDCVEMTGSAKTEVMCHLLRNKLREIGHTGDLTFYCDIAGSANRPEASRSNIAIIQEAFPAARIETRHIANIADVSRPYSLVGIHALTSLNFKATIRCIYHLFTSKPTFRQIHH